MKTELVNAIIVLRPAALVTIALTLLMVVFVAVRLRALDLRGGGSRLATLFVGLHGRSLLHLSMAWVKFAFFVSVLILAKPAQSGHFALLLILAALMLVTGFNRKMLVNELMYAVLLLLGFTMCRFLLNYLLQIRYDPGIRFVYWLLAISLTAGAMGVLIQETALISKERNYFDESGEIE